MICGSAGIGRQACLRGMCDYSRRGSSPLFRTNQYRYNVSVFLFFVLNFRLIFKLRNTFYPHKKKHLYGALSYFNYLNKLFFILSKTI